MVTKYTIETERLRLRPWRGTDVESFVAMATEEEFQWYPLRRTQTRDEAVNQLAMIRQRWLSRGFDVWAAELKETSELIGYIGLSTPVWLPPVMPAIEVGYRLGKKFWGQGLATEGAMASIKHGFEEMLMNRIICIYEPENKAGAAVVQRLGFKEYETLRYPGRPELELKVAELSRVRFQSENP